MNWRLAPIMFTIVSVVVIGILMVVALVAGYDDGHAMIVTALVGFFAALPVTYVVTNKLSHFTLNMKQAQQR